MRDTRNGFDKFPLSLEAGVHVDEKASKFLPCGRREERDASRWGAMGGNDLFPSWCKLAFGGNDGVALNAQRPHSGFQQ